MKSTLKKLTNLLSQTKQKTPSVRGLKPVTVAGVYNRWLFGTEIKIAPNGNEYKIATVMDSRGKLTEYPFELVEEE